MYHTNKTSVTVMPVLLANISDGTWGPRLLGRPEIQLNK